MVRQTKRFKKGLNKKVLSAILAASMIMTSSSFAFAAPVEELDDTPVAAAEQSLGDDADVADVTEDAQASVATYAAPLAEDANAVDAQAEKHVDVDMDDSSSVGDWSFEVGGKNTSGTYDVDYNGQEQEPKITNLKCGSDTISEDNYTVTYSDNKDAGTAYVEINIFAGKYNNRTLKKKFIINPMNLENATVVWEDVKAFEYDGSAKYPKVESATVEVTQNGEKVTLPLTEEDYDIVSGSDHVTPVKDYAVNVTNGYAVQLKGKGNFTGVTKNSDNYAIQQADLGKSVENGTVKVSVDSIEYSNARTGSELYAAVEVLNTNTKNALKSGAEYFLQCRDKNGKWTTIANSSTTFLSSYNAELINIGTHDLRILVNNSTNYVKDTYFDTTYEVVASSLATAVKDATVAGFDANGEKTYDGTNKFPTEFKTALKNTKLVYGSDYEITNTKEEWVNAGEYTLNLKGLNNYAGQTATVTVKITPKDLIDAMANATQGTHRSGNPGSVIVTVMDQIKGEDVTLVEGVDYTYEVTKEATESSKGEVEITGIGNYTTEEQEDKVLVETFDLNEEKLPLGDPSISVEYVGDYSYVNGETITLKPADFKLVETDGSTTRELKPGVDYGFVGDAELGKVAGEISVTLQGTGDYYNGTREVKINIDGTSFAEVFELEPIDDIYLDEVKTTDPKDVAGVKDVVKVVYKTSGGQYNNSSNVDIKVYDAEGEELADNFKLTENPGTYTVVVSPKADKYYTGSLETTFNVIGHDLKKAGAVVADIEDQVYTSEAITPAVTVKVGDKTLVAGEDYEVTYTDNVKGGEATAIITGINNYSGTLEKNFNITRAAQAITMTNPLQERDLGNGSRTSTSKVCTLKLATTMADEDTKYTYTTSDPSVATVNAGKITYQGVGECTITVSAAATDSCEAASLDIKVVVGKPGTPTFTPSVTKNTGKKAFVVTSSTVKGVDGWEVQYSIRDDFWKATTKDFPGTKTKLLRQTCKTVHSNMTYYIRVRGYQTVDGEKVYSDWSPVKTIVTK